MPEPLTRLPQEAAATRAAHPTPLALGVHLQARTCANPFADVFLVLEVLRSLGADTVETALSLLDVTVGHQARLLATTSAGNALLRRLDDRACGGARGHDPARLARDRDLLDRRSSGHPPVAAPASRRASSRDSGSARRRGPLGVGVAATPRRPPPHRAGPRRRGRKGARGDDLGRQVPRARLRRRMPPDPVHRGRRREAQSGATRASRRLAIVSGIAANEGNLDAVRQRDRGVISSGIHQWSAHAAKELPSLLFASRRSRPTSSSCTSASTGSTSTSIPPTPGSSACCASTLDGSRTAMDYAAIRAFFGGTVGADATSSFGRLGRARPAARRSPRRPTGAARCSRRSAASTASTRRSAMHAGGRPSCRRAADRLQPGRRADARLAHQQAQAGARAELELRRRPRACRRTPTPATARSASATTTTARCLDRPHRNPASMRSASTRARLVHRVVNRRVRRRDTARHVDCTRSQPLRSDHAKRSTVTCPLTRRTSPARRMSQARSG